MCVFQVLIAPLVQAVMNHLFKMIFDKILLEIILTHFLLVH
jgi:hypothetical protein